MVLEASRSDVKLVVVRYRASDEHPQCTKSPAQRTRSDRWVELHRSDAVLEDNDFPAVLIRQRMVEGQVSYTPSNLEHHRSNAAEEIDELIFLLTLARWIGDRFNDFWIDPIAVVHRFQTPARYRVVVLPCGETE